MRHLLPLSLLVLAAVSLAVPAVAGNTAEVATADQFVGNIEPADAASVSFKIAGRVARFPRENGDQVAAGEVIAVLDTDEVDCSVAQAEAAFELSRVNAEFARSEFGRARSMTAKKILPQNKFDAAENGFNIANAQLALSTANLRLARTNLGNSILVAPFNATLIDKSAEASEFVAPGKPVCRLIDLSSVKARFRVPEVQVAKLKIGDTIIVTLPSLDRSFTGLVVEIVPSVDPVNRTFPVTVKIANADGAIMAGMFALGRPGTSLGRLSNPTAPRGN